MAMRWVRAWMVQDQPAHRDRCLCARCWALQGDPPLGPACALRQPALRRHQRCHVSLGQLQRLCKLLLWHLQSIAGALMSCRRHITGEVVEPDHQTQYSL